MDTLSPGLERFIGRMLQSFLERSWRTPADFIRHFGPGDLISALADARDVRTRLLVQAAGVHERIASKKSAESAAEDLQLALDEGVASPELIVQIFPPAEQARYLPKDKIWQYLTEQKFWQDGQTDAVRRVALVVSVAVDEGLLALEEVLESLNLDALVEVLPEAELRAVMRYSLESGRAGKPVTELALLELLTMEKLFGFTSVSRLWDELIRARVATPHGLVTQAGAAQTSLPPQHGTPRASAARPEGRKAQTAPIAPPADGMSMDASEGHQGSSNNVTLAPDLDELFEEVGAEDELAAEVAGATAASAPEAPGEAASLRTPQEEEGRARAAERLRRIDRLPPSWERLPTPVLLAIDSMYAELLAATTDETREEIIRDSFPNLSMLRAALLSLIELLDSSIDVKDPLIAEADVDALLKVVVFEERKRYEATAGGRPSSAPQSRRVSSLPPLPATAPKGSSLPPPLPRPGAPGPAPQAAKRAR